MTTEVILDVSKYLTWYFLLGIGIMILSIWATYKHRDFMPLAYGTILTGVIVYFKEQIAPLVFGVLNYDWQTNPIMFILTGVFSMMFFAYVGLTMWNVINHNKVIA